MRYNNSFRDDVPRFGLRSRSAPIQQDTSADDGLLFGREYFGQPAFGGMNNVPLYEGMGRVGAAAAVALNDKAAKEGADLAQQYGDQYFARPEVIGIIPELMMRQLTSLENPVSLQNIFGLPMTQAPTMQAAGTNGLLQSLATKGQQQIAAGQTMNPTLGKAKV